MAGGAQTSANFGIFGELRDGCVLPARDPATLGREVAGVLDESQFLV